LEVIGPYIVLIILRVTIIYDSLFVLYGPIYETTMSIH
jgi:hypothetical protein